MADLVAALSDAGLCILTGCGITIQCIRPRWCRRSAERLPACFEEICEAYCGGTYADDKAGTMLYAMGWTQHTVGTQNIRAATLVQSLLGNIGVAGGGVDALRGWHNVQGATDHGVPAAVHSRDILLFRRPQPIMQLSAQGHWTCSTATLSEECRQRWLWTPMRRQVLKAATGGVDHVCYSV